MLYIFVEGPDDELFFQSVFGDRLTDCQYVPYARMKKEKLNSFIQSIGCIPHASYLFFADADGKDNSTRISELMDGYPALSSQNIWIVRYEIERWYYAGLSMSDGKKLGLRRYQEDTNTLTKEQFVAKLLRPSEKAYIMQRILELYNLACAVGRNESLSRFSNSL